MHTHIQSLCLPCCSLPWVHWGSSHGLVRQAWLTLGGALLRVSSFFCPYEHCKMARLWRPLSLCGQDRDEKAKKLLGSKTKIVGPKANEFMFKTYAECPSRGTKRRMHICSLSPFGESAHCRPSIYLRQRQCCCWIETMVAGYRQECQYSS